MFRELLEPEDHKNPYVYAAVWLAHALIGLVLWLPLVALGLPYSSIIAVGGYAIFEFIQAKISKIKNLKDMALDTFAVTLGMFLGVAIWYQNFWMSTSISVSIFLTAAYGWWFRAK